MSEEGFRGWRLFLCGLCMGAADLIPGISGGTVAFLLGFYGPLLESLKTLNRSALRYLVTGQWRLLAQQVAWKFLLTLLAGIACAFVAFAPFLHALLSHEVYRVYLYALFFGLILASCVLCIKQITCWSGFLLVEWGLGMGIAVLLAAPVTTPTTELVYSVPIQIDGLEVPLRNYDRDRRLLTGLSPSVLGVLRMEGMVDDETPVYDSEGQLIGSVAQWADPQPSLFFDARLAIGGALAVCALLLPGISGSYVLTLLGVYPIVIGSFVDFLKGLQTASFHISAFSVLFSLSLGICIGAVGFAGVVSWLWRRYPNHTLAVLSGFMLGAMRSVWPFWSYEYALQPLKLEAGPQLVAVQPILPSWDSTLFWVAAACALVGFSLVIAAKNLSSNSKIGFHSNRFNRLTRKLERVILRKVMKHKE